MSAKELLERLHGMNAAESINFKDIRDEIHDEFDHAATPEERIILLSIFKNVMDLAERNIAATTPNKLEEFKKIRLGDYRLLLIKEAMIGGNICQEDLVEITQREITAGRMSPDDELRKTAIDGVSTPHLSRNELIALAKNRRKSPT